MLRLALLAVLVLAACPASSPAPARPVPGEGSAPGVGAEPGTPTDAPEASQEERLAAIQRAMNELDEAAQQCWAAAAVERFDIEGDLVMQIEIAAGSARTTVVSDTARTPRLAACLTTVLESYRWAPPLHGQAIQLPFRFRAPAGQNVIDRRLVPSAGQGKLAVAVLLDDANTGNDAASMFELAIAPGATTEMRIAERAELWYFHGPATVAQMRGAPVGVGAGDMMYVPKGGAREVRATERPVSAMVVIVPGGREGTARAGALPTPAVGPVARTFDGPTMLPAAAAKTHGPATIHAEPATTRFKGASASVLALPAGTTVAEHVHATETELLYVLAGSGTMTINGVQLAVTPTSVIQIPAGIRHAFTAATDVRSVQVYTPAGPEQRFKATP